MVLVQAIIFLAPLAFDQYLEEDPTVNRLVRDLFRRPEDMPQAFPGRQYKAMERNVFE